MDQPYRHRALAHRGGDPLDRATAHVARREYARHASLEEVRLSRTFLPDLLLEHGAIPRHPRQDKASLVEFDGPSQPSGIGLSADEYKKRARIEGPAGPRAVVLDHNPLHAVLSHEFSDLSVGEQLHVPCVHDPFD